MYSAVCKKGKSYHGLYVSTKREYLRDHITCGGLRYTESLDTQGNLKILFNAPYL